VSRSKPDSLTSIDPPTWSFFREGFRGASESRTAAWRDVGLWAVDRLCERLGDDWPARTWRKTGQLPGGMAFAFGHPVAYHELVELALWLELLSDCEGYADVCRPLKLDPRNDVVPHARLQLEVGALAMQSGFGVRFERPVSGSEKTSDVSIDLPGGTSLLVEARVVLQDDRTVELNRFTDRVFGGIQSICRSYDVDCCGDISEAMSDPQLAELLTTVETHARLVAVGASAPRILLRGAALKVEPRETSVDRGLRGPALAGDLWPRIADRLEQKARQTQGARNVWFRICALQGLWLFTHWGQLGLPEKLSTMRLNIANSLAHHRHVDGVVLSSAAAWPQGTIASDEFEDGAGGYALACSIPPMLARETLVVPLRSDPETRAHARLWRDMYASEPEWLDYALDRRGLPSVARIFAPTD
jgi:hypothetical protein